MPSRVSKAASRNSLSFLISKGSKETLLETGLFDGLGEEFVKLYGFFFFHAMPPIPGRSVRAVRS
jgi:hypothetical protein